jgi:hypothetical protein
MANEYWLKYGTTETGDLTCIRVLSESKPNEEFYYKDNGENKIAHNPKVIKITKELLKKITSGEI